MSGIDPAAVERLALACGALVADHLRACPHGPERVLEVLNAAAFVVSHVIAGSDPEAAGAFFATALSRSLKQVEARHDDEQQAGRRPEATAVSERDQDGNGAV